MRGGGCHEDGRNRLWNEKIRKGHSHDFVLNCPLGRSATKANGQTQGQEQAPAVCGYLPDAPSDPELPAQRDDVRLQGTRDVLVRSEVQKQHFQPLAA